LHALEEKGSLAETRLLLADVSIEEDHAADAEASVWETAAEFHREKQSDDELWASVVLARILLTEGKPSEVQKIIEQASSLAAESQNRDTSHPVFPPAKFLLHHSRNTSSTLVLSQRFGNLLRMPIQITMPVNFLRLTSIGNRRFPCREQPSYYFC